MTSGVRLAIWSGPRNISTALMRSWENRPDCKVVDEPLYAYHLIPQLPRDWIGSLTNVLLIRDPAEVVASYVRSRANVVAEDLGLVQQAELYDQLGGATPVIDAADFLHDPEGYLRWLCAFIEVDFTPTMLHWPAGPRASDGVWAPYWYRAVRASTGFEPYRRREVALHGAALEAARRSQPDYARLRAVRVVL